MRQLKVNETYAANKLDELRTLVHTLTDMISSESFTYSQKRAMSRTIQMVTEDILSEIVGDEKPSGEIPF